MTNAALVDLAARVRSNTLTVAQQNLLGTALDKIAPLFPAVDESSNAYPILEDEFAAREWIAPLYSLSNAGGTAVDPRTVTAWYISTSAGNDANTGTSAGSPLKTFAALGAIWRGAQPGGGRATLTPATGSTITINLLDAHDPTDPMAPVLDVDLNNSASLIFVGGATVQHTGAFATVSAFARTSAGGQILVTDGTVPDFSAFFGLLIQDSTKNVVSWVYGPDGAASANGKACVPYAPQTAGVLGTPAQTNMAAADAYTLSTLFTASLGSGFTTRSYPEQHGAGGASVYFYRLAIEQPNFGDPAAINCPGVAYVFQECSVETDAIAVENTSSALFLNCLAVHASITSETGSTVECFFGGGIATGSLLAQGGLAYADYDFLVSGTGAFQSLQGGSLIMGAIGAFVTGPALLIQGGLALQAAISGLNLLYGTCGATALEVVAAFSGAASAVNTGHAATLTYFNDSSGTPAANAFKLSNGVVALGKASAANSFGFNTATGAYVGPTATTLAHLDAALGAGTGFGGIAVDPQTGSTMRLAA